MLRQSVEVAVEQGAQMIALPEAVGLMNKDRGAALKQVVPAEEDPYLLVCRELAAKHQLWIQPGSTPVYGNNERFRNHATMIDPSGEVVAEYDKIHLFDIFLEGKPPTGESNRYAPGTDAVAVDTPWGTMGLTVCYDLRFPHLYRQLAKANAVLSFVPSAFTVPTGKAHWEILLRARAIENGMWIVAPAQVGNHDDGRRTWGHSLIISPWGDVVADLGGDKPGLVTLELDISRAASVRGQIPSLANERPFGFKHLNKKGKGTAQL